MNGKVKFFNETKGFGFITDDSNQDHFVHISNILSGEPLNEGDEVSFEIREGRNGKYEAYDVALAGGASAGMNNVEVENDDEEDMA